MRIKSRNLILRLIYDKHMQFTYTQHFKRILESKSLKCDQLKNVHWSKIL